MKKIYIEKEKQQIAKQIDSGVLLNDISKKHQVPRSTIYGWLKKYSNQEKFKLLRLTKEHKKTTVKFDILKIETEIIEATNCLPTSSRLDKLNAMESLYGKYPVKRMCKVLKVSVGTFYNHLFRRVKTTIFEENDEFLKPLILEIFAESGNRFGAPKIKMKLDKMKLPFSVSEKKIYSLMKTQNLKPDLRKKRNFVNTPNTNKRLRNLLKREFSQPEPNKVWVGDITSIWVNGSLFYLCVVIDLFSRKIIGHRVHFKNNSNLTINTIKDAYEIRGEPKGVIFHSDRGAQYTSNEYTQLLKALGIVASFSNTANPYDNAVVESFFSYLKKEEVNRNTYTTIDELRESIDNYMIHYNDFRPHHSLNGDSPNEFEENYKKRDH